MLYNILDNNNRNVDDCQQEQQQQQEIHSIMEANDASTNNITTTSSSSSSNDHTTMNNNTNETIENDSNIEFLSHVNNEYNKNTAFLKIAFCLMNARQVQLLFEQSIFSPGICTIKYLDLTGNRMGNEGCKCVAQMLANNTSIEVLNLCMNDISSSGVISLCRVLSNKEQQKQQQQHETGVSASPTTARISSPNTLHYSLHQHHQQQKSQVSKKNFTLKHLDLSMNRLGNEGMEHLSHMLQNNETLVTLSVRSNKVKSQQGVAHLLEMLATAHNSDTLQEVFV
jgi:hypothetical protein